MGGKKREEQRGRDAPLYVYFLLADFIVLGNDFFVREVIHIP